MANPNPKVDAFFARTEKWKSEMGKLREIALSCPLSEELKWGVPCYSLDGSNVALIHGFKEYCAILFVKGALMNDPQGLLITQTANVQAGRQVRFTKMEEIVKLEAVLKEYLLEAIRVEKAGLKVDFKKTSEFAMPDEFKQALENAPALKTAFEALTPGRQRAYLLYFAAPKQAQTRTARVEKCTPQIMAGKGLND